MSLIEPWLLLPKQRVPGLRYRHSNVLPRREVQGLIYRANPGRLDTVRKQGVLSFCLKITQWKLISFHGYAFKFIVA